MKFDLQLESPEAREKAKKALLELWDAMELSACLPMSSDGGMKEVIRNSRMAAYFYFGKMLLGHCDCPEREVPT